MSKGRHSKAYESMCRLRYAKVQAARDQFYMFKVSSLVDFAWGMIITTSDSGRFWQSRVIVDAFWNRAWKPNRK